MQETIHKPDGRVLQEFFHGKVQTVEEAMNRRLEQLKKQDHVLSRRVQFKKFPNRFRNKPCPCGSGKKVKQCCALVGGPVGEKS